MIPKALPFQRSGILQRKEIILNCAVHFTFDASSLFYVLMLNPVSMQPLQLVSNVCSTCSSRWWQGLVVWVGGKMADSASSLKQEGGCYL